MLSDSTEAFDRGDKFSDDKTVPDLEEYALVHQKQGLVERFRRKSDHLRLPQVFGAGENVEFESVGMEVLIADLYENFNQLSH